MTPGSSIHEQRKQQNYLVVYKRSLLFSLFQLLFLFFLLNLLLLLVDLFHSITFVTKGELAQIAASHTQVILIEILLTISSRNRITILVHSRAKFLSDRITKLVSFLTIASSNWIAELVILLTKASGVRITVLVNGISWHDPSVNDCGWRFRSIVLINHCLFHSRAPHWMDSIAGVGRFEILCLLIRCLLVRRLLVRRLVIRRLVVRRLLIRQLRRFHVDIIEEVVAILRVVAARTLALIALASLLTLA